MGHELRFEVCEACGTVVLQSAEDVWCCCMRCGKSWYSEDSIRANPLGAWGAVLEAGNLVLQRQPSLL